MILYTVRAGDSLYRIAREFGISPQRLAIDNGLAEPERLVVGQTLVILQPEQSYTVVEGDTLYTVAQKFGVTIGDLWRNNPFLNGGTALEAGQILTIRPEPTLYEREIATNAYVYPSVDRTLLRKMLPFLTYLTIFTYRIEEDGGLVEIDDEEIIELARQYGTAPLMLVSTLNERGGFSSELAADLLSDPQAQEMLIEEIVTTLAQKRYRGVDVDFEYVPAEYAEEYADLIARIQERLSPLGYLTVVSLAPKTSSDQQGLLYEAHDYGALGAAADRAFLMTYEWGYRFGPPMAVSPVNQVRRVVEYALGEIPAQKIFLGVPNYGYDWLLPYVAGETRARSLGNEEAIRLAREKRARIEYDEEAEAPYFRYFQREGGRPVEHEVWFEDANSVLSMLELVNEYGLDGIGIWNGMRDFMALWQVLAHTNPIRKIWG